METNLHADTVKWPDFASYIPLLVPGDHGTMDDPDDLLKAIITDAKEFDRVIGDILLGSSPMPPSELAPRLERVLGEATELHRSLDAINSKSKYDFSIRFHNSSRYWLGHVEDRLGHLLLAVFLDQPKNTTTE